MLPELLLVAIGSPWTWIERVVPQKRMCRLFDPVLVLSHGPAAIEVQNPKAVRSEDRQSESECANASVFRGVTLILFRQRRRCQDELDVVGINANAPVQECEDLGHGCSVIPDTGSQSELSHLVEVEGEVARAKERHAGPSAAVLGASDVWANEAIAVLLIGHNLRGERFGHLRTELVDK